MTEQLIEQGNVQRTILAEFRKRVSSVVLEELFSSTTLLQPSMGRTNYLRQVVKDSVACDENFNTLAAYCKEHTGAMFGRRASFRMGVCLGLLMSEQIPREYTRPQARVGRPGRREKQEQESVAETTTLSHDCEAVAVEA